MVGSNIQLPESAHCRTAAYMHMPFPEIQLHYSPCIKSEDYRQHHGLRGLIWKFARIGERLSPLVAICCMAMGITVFFT
eukprot:jgi/Bigna1/130413/aug1.11_g5121